MSCDKILIIWQRTTEHKYTNGCMITYYETHQHTKATLVYTSK